MTRRPLRVVHRSHRTRPLRRIRPACRERARGTRRWPSWPRAEAIMTASFKPDVTGVRGSGLSVSFFGFGFVTKQFRSFTAGRRVLPVEGPRTLYDDVRSGGASHLAIGRPFAPTSSPATAPSSPARELHMHSLPLAAAPASVAAELRPASVPPLWNSGTVEGRRASPVTTCGRAALLCPQYRGGRRVAARCHYSRIWLSPTN